MNRSAQDLEQFAYSASHDLQEPLRSVKIYSELLSVRYRNQVLKDTLENLSQAIADSGARVTSDALPSLPVHNTHLQQLLQNLIGNAIKYRSPERPPVIHIGAHRQDVNWVLEVCDNGIGIEPEYKEHIFGFFKRLHTGDEQSGTGIGLAICQRIVERYQGRIWVESEPGRGSTFRFSLPA